MEGQNASFFWQLRPIISDSPVIESLSLYCGLQRTCQNLQKESSKQYEMIVSGNLLQEPDVTNCLRITSSLQKSNKKKKGNDQLPSSHAFIAIVKNEKGKRVETQSNPDGIAVVYGIIISSSNGRRCRIEWKAGSRWPPMGRSRRVNRPIGKQKSRNVEKGKKLVVNGCTNGTIIGRNTLRTVNYGIVGGRRWLPV